MFFEKFNGRCRSNRKWNGVPNCRSSATEGALANCYCYHKCVKMFFCFDRLYSVTQMLSELNLPTFDNLLLNCVNSFCKCCAGACHNALIENLNTFLFFIIIIIIIITIIFYLCFLFFLLLQLHCFMDLVVCNKRIELN